MSSVGILWCLSSHSYRTYLGSKAASSCWVMNCCWLVQGSGIGLRRTLALLLAWLLHCCKIWEHWFYLVAFIPLPVLCIQTGSSSGQGLVSCYSAWHIWLMLGISGFPASQNSAWCWHNCDLRRHSISDESLGENCYHRKIMRSKTPVDRCWAAQGQDQEWCGWWTLRDMELAGTSQHGWVWGRMG